MSQLCVTIPTLEGAELDQLLAQIFETSAIAAVVIAPRDGAQLSAQTVLPIVAAVQKAGAAALISGDSQLARVVKADGVHLPAQLDSVAAAEEAREILGRGAIVGVDAGRSRHTAMELGELGVDYVAFACGGAEADDGLDLAIWWAELFEIPVVALGVTEAETASALAAADADFISIDVADQSGLARLAACAGAIAAPLATTTV